VKRREKIETKGRRGRRGRKGRKNRIGRRKLDGVGPVDNRPSTDKLHHFVQKKKVTCDM
jgi:hypothetical protein